MSILNMIFGDVSWKDLDIRDAAGWEGMLGTVSTYTGEPISATNSMRLSAYYRCTANISEAIGQLPFKVYQQNGKRGSGATTHPAYKLIYAEPNSEMTAESFRTTMTAHALNWGNGYAEIELSNGGEPIGLWPIHPSRMEPKRNNNGDLIYLVHMEKGDPVPLPPEKILHIHGIGVDGVLGLSIARQAAQTLGIRMAAAKYGASYFRNASRPSGILSHPDSVVLDPEKKAALRSQWNEVYGGVDNVGRVVVLEGGGKYQNISIPPDEAQFIQTMNTTDLEICRWFNMPPWKIGIQDQAKGWGTVEATNTHYVQDTLMIWAIRWESEINRKLLGGYDSGFYSKIEFQALLRGDLKTRQEYYRTMLTNGVYSVNTVLELEDMDPIGPEGDKHLVQVNLTPLDKVGEEKPAAPFQQNAPDDEGDEEEEENEETEETEEEANAFANVMPILVDAASRIIRKREHAFSNIANKAESVDDFVTKADSFMARTYAENVDMFKPSCEAVGRYPTALVHVVYALDTKAKDNAVSRYETGQWDEYADEKVTTDAQTYAKAVNTLLTLEG